MVAGRTEHHKLSFRGIPAADFLENENILVRKHLLEIREFGSVVGVIALKRVGGSLHQKR